MEDIIPNKAKLFYVNDDVLRIDFAQNSDIGLLDAKQIVKVCYNISNGCCHSNIVDIRNVGYIDIEARKFFASINNPAIMAVAIVIKTNMHKSLIDRYIDVDKPKIQTSFFINEFEALEWLKKLINNKN